jgi:lipopolysaccharide/colanic/teichoic acid biosynthesis glycosyltransferase
MCIYKSSILRSVRDKNERNKKPRKNVPPFLLDPLIRLDEIPQLFSVLSGDNTRVDVRPTSQIVEYTRGDGGCY